MAGALVAFEGVEGAGKSTQVRRLRARLEEADVPVVAVREPGGTAVGDAIRALLLDPASSLDGRTEALLFMASRAQLVREVIRPALERGAFVLTDRFFLSTYAYQIAGRGLPEVEVREANRLATAGLTPDLTLVLDLPLADGMRRARQRSGPDRIESTGREFHERVRCAFLEYVTPAWQAAHPECGPIVRVSGEGTEDEVAARVLAVLAERWPRTFAALAGSQL